MQREGRSVCSDRERVCGDIERGGVCVERERDVEIECVQNDRNVFMSRDRKMERVCVCERVKRDIKEPLPVRVRVRFRLSGILSGFPFSDILFSSILSGIRFGLHRGNPRATTSYIIL